VIPVAFVSNSARGEFTGRFRWIPSLAAEGFRVTFLLPGGENEYGDRMRRAGVPIVEYRLDRRSIASPTDARSIADLTRAIGAGRFVIVHSFGHKANMYAGIAAAIARTPVRFQQVIGLGDPFLTGPARLRRWIARAALIRGYRWLAPGVCAFFFHNPDDKAHFDFLPERKAVLTRGTGVDPDEYRSDAVPSEAADRLRREFGVGPQYRVVTFAGRLKAEKGVPEFLAAARSVAAVRDDVVFLVAGEADHELGRRLLSGAPHPLIRFVGRRDDMRELLALTDIFVNPSRREGLPRANLEAMAMGKPVVTTDVPGCRETIVDGCHGLLVPAQSPDRLAAAILRLLSLPGLRAQMGRAGRARIETEFSASAIARQIAACYRRALAEKGSLA
jgi:N,N'-diacetylbacillosaminyl-diphospho-undecaprenol alpha-1,3-N-acetylgalactosaminyltransferase